MAGVAPTGATSRRDVVVNAGGMFAAEIGRLAGVRIPIVPMAHEYLVTQPFRERDPESPLPTLRDPDLLIYFREEGGGLVMGGYERQSRAVVPARRRRRLDAIPPDFNGRLLEDDWDRFEEIVVNSRQRVPAMEDVNVTRMINGPEAFTPTTSSASGRPRCAASSSPPASARTAWPARAGSAASWPSGSQSGEPRLDLWHMDIRRFGAHYRSPRYTLARVREVYETYYDIRYPGHERQAGRPLRLSPAYAWHARARRRVRREVGLGARQLVRGERGGGRRVAAPARLGGPALVAGDRRRARAPAASARRCSTSPRSRSSRSTGPGAAESSSACATTASRATPGKVTYTQMLNRRGGIECDFTVTRLAEDRFSIVTGTAFGNHDRAWIRRHLPRDGPTCGSRDVTSQWACFGSGDRAPATCSSRCTPQDLSAGLPVHERARDRPSGDVPVRALRVTYVGELGWELYCPAEYGAALWRTLWEAGAGHGLVAGGYRAIDSLRLEKGYRVWGADITPDENPYQGGLGLLREARQGVRRPRGAAWPREDGGPARLCCLVLADPRSVALGNEPVRAAARSSAA